MSKMVDELWKDWADESSDNYGLSSEQIDALFAHTRKCEEMLGKHEWEVGETDGYWCIECGGGKTYNGHSSDCELAKLIE
jgi:hypothetical protein